MKIVGLTMVANEQEIIESFVRYNLNFLDEIVFVSSCCVDNTNLIIRNLIKEGCPLRLFEERDIAFEQRRLDNKYLKMLAMENNSDWIVPLDCDEFISADITPSKIFADLSQENIYLVKWKNYIMTTRDDVTEPFIPRRCQYILKDNPGDNFTKVIVPTKAIISKQISLDTGHHLAIGKEMPLVLINNMRFAHFPTVSVNQYKLRLYERSIKCIIWRSFGFNEGKHIHRQIEAVENGADVFELSCNYTDKQDELQCKQEPLDLHFCVKYDLTMRYSALSKTDILKGVQRIGQLMAIKAYLADIGKEEYPGRDKILIYGVGEGAERLLNGMPYDLVNILAYIDSDGAKKFCMYNHKLVIPPTYIRFFDFDYIVISGTNYFEEMRNTLRDMGVDDDKICTSARLFDALEKGVYYAKR